MASETHANESMNNNNAVAGGDPLPFLGRKQSMDNTIPQHERQRTQTATTSYSSRDFGNANKYERDRNDVRHGVEDRGHDDSFIEKMRAEANAPKFRRKHCPIHRNDDRGCLEICGDSEPLPTNLLGMKGIFVANLAADCAHSKLYDIFGQFGPLECIEKTVTSGAQGETKAFAYISYKQARFAIDALGKVGRELFGPDVVANATEDFPRPLDMSFTGSKSQRIDPNRVFSNREAVKRITCRNECFDYRMGLRCPNGQFCPLRHIRNNFGIDRRSLVAFNMPLP